MEATGVFSSCVTALMKASCCSFRRISRTRNVVLRTTPLLIVNAKIVGGNERMRGACGGPRQPFFHLIAGRGQPARTGAAAPRDEACPRRLRAPPLHYVL